MESLTPDDQAAPAAPCDAIVDVGANSGGFALAAAARNPGRQVFAIEPIPELADGIDARAAAEHLGNLVCLRLAVDDAPRRAILHVSEHHDQGISSLFDLDAEAIAANAYWGDRPDLYFSKDIEVTVARMDQALPWSEIGRIRFVKIDAQGFDLAVLRSFGAELGRVDAGMLEVPGVLASRLYQGEAADLGTAFAELRGLGFEIYAVKPNDHASNEFNVYFHRVGVDWRALEQELGLPGIALYDGRHFWHLPADRMLHADSAMAAAEQSRRELAACQEELASLRVQQIANLARADAAEVELAASMADVAGLRGQLADAFQAAERLQARLDTSLSEAALARDRLAGAFSEAVAARRDAAAAMAEIGRLAGSAEQSRQAWAAVEMQLRGQAAQQAIVTAGEIARLRGQIASIMQSHSMRVTRPLRYARAMLSRLLQTR